MTFRILANHLMLLVGAQGLRTLDPLIKSQLLYQLSSLVIAARADQAATVHEGSGKDRLADDRLSAGVGG